MAAAVDVSFAQKYEYRWAIPVRGGQVMLVPAMTQAQARLFLETIQLEFAKKAVLYQRAAGKWIKVDAGTGTAGGAGTAKTAVKKSGSKPGAKKKTKAYA
jgi:hypothetical protein